MPRIQSHMDMVFQAGRDHWPSGLMHTQVLSTGGSINNFPLRTATVVCFYFFTKSNPQRHAIKWLAVSGYSKWIYFTVEETRKSNRSNKTSIIFKHRKLAFLPLTTHETALLHGFWSGERKTYLIGSLGECVLTHSVKLFVSPRTAAHQAPLSMGFSRQEYWSRLPFPSPGGLSNPGIEPPSLASAALAGGLFTNAPSRKPNGTSSSQNPMGLSHLKTRPGRAALSCLNSPPMLKAVILWS